MTKRAIRSPGRLRRVLSVGAVACAVAAGIPFLGVGFAAADGGDDSTSTTLSANHATITEGSAVTFTAVVTCIEQNPDTSEPTNVPTGSVTFTDVSNGNANTKTLAAVSGSNNQAKATYGTTGLSVGTHTFSATYGGSSDCKQSASQQNAVVTVNRKSSPPPVVAQPTTLKVGAALIQTGINGAGLVLGDYTGLLTVTNTGAPVVGRTVTFTTGTTTLCTGTTNTVGRAECQDSNLVPDLLLILEFDGVRGHFAGDSHYLASDGSNGLLGPGAV